MFPDLYRSRPTNGLIYVAMCSLRSPKLLWWKVPVDPTKRDEPITASEVPAAVKEQAYDHLYHNRSKQNAIKNRARQLTDSGHPIASTSRRWSAPGPAAPAPASAASLPAAAS
jgi:hypothetical protein